MRVPAGNAEDLRARLIDAGGLSLDRMPMLNVVFDRLTSGCSDNLKPLVASPVYFAFDGLASGRFGEMLDAYEGNAVAGLFHAPEWNSHILVGLDRDFLFTLVEALFGADGSEPPSRTSAPSRVSKFGSPRPSWSRSVRPSNPRSPWSRRHRSAWSAPRPAWNSR